MKKFGLIALWTVFLAAWLSLPTGCSDSTPPVGNGKPGVATGLPPVAFLAKTVGGDKIQVHCLLPEGRSPHDYSPGAHDIRNAAASKLFLTTGMLFEKSIARSMPKQLRIVDVSQSIKRIPFTTEGCDHGHDHDHGHKHDHDASDPHVWLSPDNALAIAAVIRDELIRMYPQDAGIFRRNYDKLAAELSAIGREVKEKMAPWRGRAFYVYHPAFGYFADYAGLKQIGIELGGREASPARLADVIKSARAHQVRAVFVQPQFNPASARALGKAIGGEVIELDPLAGDLPGNFRKMTDALQRGFGKSTTGGDGKNH